MTRTERYFARSEGCFENIGPKPRGGGGIKHTKKSCCCKKNPKQIKAKIGVVLL